MTLRTPTETLPTRPRPLPRSTAERTRFFGLSLTQLFATAGAAITATVAGSFLGVSGTVLGAALASVVTAVGNAVYGTSIRRTQERVRSVVPGVVPASGRWAPRTVRHARSTPRPGPGNDVAPTLPSPSPRVRPRPRPERRDSPWRRVALGTIAVFVCMLAAVTVVETIAGRPLTDLLRGDSGSGTTVFGGSSGRSTHVTVPTVTQTVTPSVVLTTPVVTQTAPARTVTTTPSATPTSTPSGASTGTPTDAATSGAATDAP